MHLGWQARLQEQPQYADFGSWPQVYPNEVPKKSRKGLLRNQRVAAMAVSGVPLSKISESCSISVSRVSQIMTRALAGDADSPPALTKALIPGARLKPPKRASPLGTSAAPSGPSHSFNALLGNVPGLLDHLYQFVANSMRNSIDRHNISASIFHREFLRYLQLNGYPMDTYPFTHASTARESCRKLYHHIRNTLHFKRTKPSKSLRVPQQLITLPYEEVQIDSQILDIFVSIEQDDGRGRIRNRLQRPSLFIAIDVATGAILAYQLCITKDPATDDLLALLENIHRPWSPMNLSSEGLEYAPGATMPSSLGEVYQNANIGLIRADNALCHMSLGLQHYVCNHLTSAVNFSLPSSPLLRNWVENIFNYVNSITHQFGSTSGSHHKDPVRLQGKASKGVPTVTLGVLQEVLSVGLTRYNIMPQERLGAKSPIAFMRDLMENGFPQISYKSLLKPRNPFASRKQVKIYKRKDGLRPYCRIFDLKYTGDCLYDLVLIEKRIIFEFDIRDIRRMEVFTLEGERVGTVSASRSWQRLPISVRTRKQISKKAKELRINMSDPVGSYLSRLSSRLGNSKAASELARVHSELLRSGSSIISIDEYRSEAIKVSETKTNAKSKILPWTPASNQIGKRS